MGPMNYITGPQMCNYHELIKRVKEAVDPRNAANPGYPVPHEPPTA